MKRAQAFFLTLLMLVSTVLGYCEPVKASSGLGTVTLSIERFVLGQGYLIEPVLVDIEEGDDYSILLDRVLNQYGIGYTCTGKPGWSFYLSGIKNADTGKLDIPQCVQDMSPMRDFNGNRVYPPNNSAVNDAYPDLREKSFNSMSGWMYSVNNVFPNVGMEGTTPHNGDVCRIQFTVFGYGLDLEGSDLTYYVADKTALTEKIAQINQNPEEWFSVEGCKENYDSAMRILQQVDASQESVDNILQKLPERAPVYPETVTLSKEDLQLYVNETEILKAEVLPESADDKTLLWTSSNPAAASVSAGGKITALAPGETDIAAQTVNGISAVCHVSVQDRKITEITLNRPALNMEANQTFQLSVISYKPANATETLQVQYSSDHPEIASVNAEGLVTAHAYGTARITARTAGGVQAECEVLVGDAKETAAGITKKIEKLPASAEDVNWDNAWEIIAVYEEYNNLSEEAKTCISEKNRKKILSLAKKAEQIQEQQKKVAEVIRAIENLPSPSEITMNDEQQIQGAKEAFDSLSVSEKGKIGTEDRLRLNSAVKRIEEMQQEIEDVIERINGLPEQADLDAARQVLDTADQYDMLSESQKERISADLADRIEKSLDTLIRTAEETINAVVEGTLPDIESSSIQNFLRASNFYEELDSEKQEKFSEQTIQKLNAVRENIGQTIHTNGKVTVDGYWFIKTEYQNLDTSKDVLKKICGMYDAKNAKAVMHGNITYKDIRTGSIYEQEKAAEIRIQVSDIYKRLKKPVLLRKDKNSLEEIEFTYDDSTGEIVFHSRETGEFVFAELEIPITGITIPVSKTVGKNESIALKVKAVPEDTTDDYGIVWKSKDETIAKVDKEGNVTGVKEGKTKITASVKGNSSLKASCTITVTTKANELDKSVEDVLKETKSYILSIDTNPAKGSEWFALGLARYGMDLDSEYFKVYYNHVANYLKENNGDLGYRYTEYSKLTLALTAIGKDARDVGGYNLLSYLADFDEVKSQGNNGPIWALIALKSNPEYEIPKVEGVSTQTTEELLIDAILKSEVPGGGWDLRGEKADSDMTGMALQALAPYYNKTGYEKVTEAIERGIRALSNMQLSNGGYGTMGAETSESNAQVITALCALGIDPQTDQRFIKNGNWTVENLIGYHIDNSGFMHVKAGAANNGGGEGGKVNGMATEQGFYALVAYQRLKDGKTSLYDMSDLTVKAGGGGDNSGTGLEDDKNTGNGSDKNTNSGDNNSDKKTEQSNASSSSNSTSGKKASAGGTSKSASSTSKKAATSSKKTVEEKKADADKEEESGWSFDGEEYTPDTSESKTAGTEDAGAAAKGQTTAIQKIFAKANMPYFLCIGCGVILLVFCIWMIKKKDKT